MSAINGSDNSGSGLATGTDAGMNQPLNQGQKTQNHQVEQSEQNARPGEGHGSPATDGTSNSEA